MKIFLNLFLYVLIAVSASFSAADGDASDRNNCNGIVEAKKGDSNLTPVVKEGDEWVICKRDFSLISLNLLFNEAFSTDSTVRWFYDLAEAPVPDEEGSYKMVSGLLDMTAYSISALFFKVFLPLLFVVGLAYSVKMANGANIRDVLKNKTAWASAGGLLIFAVLMYPLDKYMLGQALVIGAAIFSIKLGLFVLSSVIEIFNFQAMIGGDTEQSLFNASSKAYANSLIVEAYASRESTLRLNREGLNGTEREVTINKDGLVRLPQGEMESTQKSSWFGSGGRSEENTTNKSYLVQSLTQSVIAMKMNNVIEQGWTHPRGYRQRDKLSDIPYGYSKTLSWGQTATSASNAITHEELDNYKSAGIFIPTSSNGEGIFSPYATEQQSIKDLYSSTEIAVGELPVSMPPATANEDKDDLLYTVAIDMVKEIKKQDYRSLMSYPSGEPTLHSVEESALKDDKVKVLADKIVQNAKLFSEHKYGDNSTAVSAYLQTAAAEIIGYPAFKENHKKSGTRPSHFAYNPNNIDAFNKRASGLWEKTLLYGLLSDAHLAAFEAAKYACLNMMSDKNASEMTDVVSQIELYMAATNSETANQKMKSDNAPTNHSSQCLAYSNNGLEILLPNELYQSAKAVIEDRTKTPDDVRAYLVLEVDRYNNEKIEALEKMTLYRDRMATVMNNVQKVVTKGTKLHLEKEATDELAMDVLTSMREQGLASVVGYFAKVSQELASRLIELRSTQITTSSKTYVEEKTLFPPFSEDKIEKLRNQDNIVTVFSPQGALLNELLTGKGSAATLVYGGSPSGSFGMSMDDFVDTTVNLALLDQSILINGFGINSSSGGTFVNELARCADGSCYKFSQHPVITLSLYGSEMLFAGGVITILAAFSDIITQGVSSFAEVIGDMGSLLGGIAGPVGLTLTGFGWVIDKFLALVVVTFKVVIALIAPIGTLYLILGLMMCFMLPIIPIVGYLMMWIMWFLEVAMVFVFFPVFTALYVVKIDGKRLLPGGKFLGLYLSIALKPMLFLASFVLFYSLSYITIYLINSMAGVMLSNFGGVGFFQIIMGVISMMIVLYLYYKCLVKIYSSTQEMPNRILHYIGVQGFDVGGMSNAEQLVGSIGVADRVQGAFQSAGKKATDSVNQSRDKKVSKKVLDAAQEALNDSGNKHLDIRELIHKSEKKGEA